MHVAIPKALSCKSFIFPTVRSYGFDDKTLEDAVKIDFENLTTYSPTVHFFGRKFEKIFPSNVTIILETICHMMFNGT